jgi:hypothetical protein
VQRREDGLVADLVGSDGALGGGAQVAAQYREDLSRGSDLLRQCRAAQLEGLQQRRVREALLDELGLLDDRLLDRIELGCRGLRVRIGGGELGRGALGRRIEAAGSVGIVTPPLRRRSLQAGDCTISLGPCGRDLVLDLGCIELRDQLSSGDVITELHAEDANLRTARWRDCVRMRLREPNHARIGTEIVGKPHLDTDEAYKHR